MTHARFTLALAALLAGAMLASPARAARLEAVPAAVTVSGSEGATVRLQLTAKTADGRARSGLRFLAESNFGSVGSVSETAPGRYQALLELPPTDMPRAALVLFSAQDSETIELHHATVPVTVSTYLRARTEPRSQITIDAAGRSFGPAQAGRAGWFTLAFEQPPGTEEAEVRIVDAAGNVRRSVLAVPVRPHDALIATLDRYRVASDGRDRVRVHALVFDKRGRPVLGARLTATADRGSLSDFVDHGDGVYGAEWSAPSDGGEGIATLRLRVRHGGRVHEETERISIVKGPAGRLNLTAEPAELVAGESRSIELRASVADAAGNGLPGETLRLTTDRGSLEELRDLGDGRYASRLLVPEGVGSGSIEVKALLIAGEPEQPPARITVSANPEVVPTSWRAFSLVTATVTDEAGAPVPGEVVLFHVARGEGIVTPAAVTNAEGRAFADFSANPTEEIVAVEATATSVLGLKGETRIEKRASGEFAIINRPAAAARGGRTQAVYDFSEDHRVLQATVLITIRPGMPAALGISAEPSVLIADGRSTSRVTAVLKDALGNEIPDAEVRFSVDSGTIGGVSNVSDGRYQATYTAPEGRGEGRAVVTATEAGTGLSATTVIELEVGPPAALALLTDRDEMPADGDSRAVLTATVEDASGQPVPGATVIFRSSGVEAAFHASATSDAQGTARIDVTAGRDPGPLTMTAGVGAGLSASVDIELLPTEPVELTLTASPASILADGAERAELTAELLDPFGQAVGGHLVDFRIDQGPGVLSARTARSDALGLARVWLSATDSGNAQVSARSVMLPSLHDETDVELRPAALIAAFSADAPACAGSVRLHSGSNPALDHEWDWTGDGVADARGPSVLAPLPAGTATVRLRIRDDAGNEAADEQLIEVFASPEAVALAGATHVAAGRCTSLDGNASTAGTTGALSYGWDLDGDGDEDALTARVADWCEDDGEAVATLTVVDENGCTSSDQVTVVFGDIPDLVISVAAAAGTDLPLPAGSAFEVDVAWGNTGLAEAPAAVVSLELSPELSLDGPPPAGAQELGGGRIALALGDVAAGASGRFSLSLRATDEPDHPSSVARVTAGIRHAVAGGESPPVQDAVNLAIVPEVDVALSCSGPSTGKPGQPIRLDLTLENRGASLARDASIEINWQDDELELIASVPAGAASPGRLRLDWPGVPGRSGESIRLDFRLRAVMPAPDNRVRVAAHATHAGVDRSPGDESCETVVDSPACADTWATVRASPERTPARPGDTILYELRYGNRGSTGAAGVVIEGRFDPEAFLSSLVENPDSGIFSAADGTIRFLPSHLPADPDREYLLRYRARIAASIAGGAGEVRTEVEVQHSEPDCRPVDDRDLVTVPVEAAPVIALDVQAPASVQAGSTASFLLHVSSVGDVPAEAVAVDYAFSGASATIVTSRLPPGATLLPGGGIRFDCGDMAVGAALQFGWDVRTDAPQPAVDPVLRNDWTAAYGPAADRRSTPLQRDVAVDARDELNLELQLSASALAAGEVVEASVTLRAGGDAPSPGGTLDLSCDPAHFDGTPVTGVAYPSLAPGDSIRLGPWPLRAAAVLPSPLTTTAVTATATGTTLSDSGTITLTAAPSLELRIAQSPSEVQAGDWATLTVAHRNAGSTAATGVMLSLTEGSGLVTEFDPPLRSLGVVPADGIERTVSVRGRLADSLPGCRIPVAIVPHATFAEAPGSASGAAAAVDGLGRPDLRLDLTGTPSRRPPGPGDLITYELTVTNTGNAPALSPSLTLERDPVLLPDVVPPLPAGAIVSGSDVVIPLADLEPFASATRTVRLRVAASLPAPSNPARAVASASEASCESRVDDNTVNLVMTVGAVADLVVAMDVRTDPAPLSAGGSVGATLFLSNAGTTDAEDVHLTLEYPDPLVAAVLDDGGGATGPSGRLSWGPLTIPAGLPPVPFDLSFQVAGELPDTSSLFALLAAATTTSPENQLGNNRADATITARASADLCVELTEVLLPRPAGAAGRIEYRLTVRNDGTTTATDTLVTLDYDSALLSPQGGGPDPFEWRPGDLAPGTSVDLVQTFTITDSIPGGTATAIATARAAAAEHDAWGLATCDASSGTETVITDEADLALTKTLTGSDPIPLRGSLLQYTIVVENRGNSDADLGGPSVGAVEDLIPAGLLVASTGGGVQTGSTLRWDLPARIRRGDSWSVSYELAIDPALPAGVHRLTNSARVLPAGPDASPANDQDAETIELRFDVDLRTSVTCAAVPAPAVPGSPIEYEVVVENLGASDATNVTLALDGGGRLIHPAPPAGPALLPAQGRWSTRFTGHSLDAFADPVTVVTMTAVASSFEADADPGNDRGEASCNVLASVDLRARLVVSEADGTPPAEAAEDLDVSVTIENVGSRIESGVEALLTFNPALATFLSGTGFTEEAPGRIRHVHAGDSDPRVGPESFDLRFRSADVLATGLEVLEFCVELSSPGPDIFPADNRACRQLQLFASPDLRVTHSASTSSTPAAPGEAISHEVLIENLGTTAATGVVLQHLRDAVRTTGLLPGSASHAASQSGDRIDLSVGTVSVGDSVMVAYQVGIAPAQTLIDDSAASDACASSSEPDANPADNCDDVAVAIEALPDAAVTLRVEPSTGLRAGGTATGFIDYGNLGASPLVNPVLRLDLDPSLLLVDGSGVTGPGPLVLTGLPPLAPREWREEMVVLRLADTLPDVENSLSVRASLSHDEAARDADGSNDSAEILVGGTGQVDLVTTLSLLSPAEPQAGDLLVYEVGWTNAGSTTATGVTLDLAPDVLLSLDDGSAPPDPDTRPLPDLAPGAGGSLQVSYRLPPTLPQDLNTIAMRAGLVAAEPDAAPADNIAWFGFSLAARSDVRVSALTFTASPDPLSAGSTVTLVAEHDNHGTTIARGTQLVFSFDETVAALVNANGGSFDGVRTVAFDLGDVEVTAGAASSTSIQLRAHDVQASLAEGLALSAEISAANEPAALDGDNVRVQFPTVLAEPDLVAEIRFDSSNPDPAHASGTVTLVASVANTGSTRAAQARLRVSWPDGLVADVVDDDGAAGSDALSAVWDLGTLQPGDPAVERRVTLLVADVLPSASNSLVVTALATSLDSEANTNDNTASVVVELLAGVDLVLSTEVLGDAPVGDGDVIFYRHTLTNVGSTAAPAPCVRSSYDARMMQYLPPIGTDLGTVVESCMLTPLAPGDAPWTRPLGFVAVAPADGSVRHELKGLHEAAESGKTPADDSNPADNVTNTSTMACFLSVGITSPSPPAICLNSSITLVATPSTEAGVTYLWSAPNGGSFEDSTAKVTTFTPPARAGNYPVNVAATHPSGCTATSLTRGQDFLVQVVADCSSCGCHPANLKLVYVDGTLERIDVPGSRDVAAGETVAFRILVTDSGTGKSATIRTGTTFSFRDRLGRTYSAQLAYPVFYECRQTVELVFTSAQVPADMEVGNYQPELLVDALDACGNGSPRTSNVTDDVSVGPGLNALDPGVSFSDWGPEAIRR